MNLYVFLGKKKAQTFPRRQKGVIVNRSSGTRHESVRQAALFPNAVIYKTCTGARILVRTITSGGSRSRNGYNEAKHRIPMDGGTLVRVMGSKTDTTNVTFNNLCNFYWLTNTWFKNCCSQSLSHLFL
jgi:hypothetical protein